MLKRLNKEDRTAGDTHLEPTQGGYAPSQADTGTVPAYRGSPDELRSLQRKKFGGLHWGAAFFGWLVATGLATILTAILAAAGAAIGLTVKSTAGAVSGNAGTIGIVGGALLLLALMVSYYFGGYVAGRMSRFDGARQGVGVWLWNVLITVVLAVAGLILGSQYNVLASLHLPSIPLKQGALVTGGSIALAAIFLGTLLAAMLGGKVGERYHLRVDRLGDGVD